MFTRHLFLKFFLFVLMTLIASIITFSKTKKNGKKNVTLDPRHRTLALDMEPRPSTLDKKIDSQAPRGAYFFKHFLGVGGLKIEGGFKERGRLFNLVKRITFSKSTAVRDRVDLPVVQLKSLSKVFNS